MLTVVNPATGEKVAEYPCDSQDVVRSKIARSHEAYVSWRGGSMDRRAALLLEVSRLLRARRDALARLMATEMGKPITSGLAEVEKCAVVSEYYAANSAKFLAPETVETEALLSLVAYRPIGPVLAVMPWNFPLWQVFRFAAPALMAGNTALLKHASNVPGCALAIEQIFSDAGSPEGLFTTLLIGSRAVAEVIADPRVSAVTVTGSVEAGKAVASMAGAALKKTVLELGGSDAYVVLEDADVEAAASISAASRLINSGQSCIAAKRFVVVEAVRRRFEEAFVERMRAAVMGDPLDPATTVGPQARADLRDGLQRDVLTSLSSGARLLLGGSVPPAAGAWYPPTVLTDVRPGMPAYSEELFGPVGAIIPVPSEAEAIRVANDSRFGLGGAVFTRDEARGLSIATHDLEVGSAFVNAFVRSDPRLPFGGIKDSGYGRELAAFGIREFVNVKTVYLGRSLV